MILTKLTIFTQKKQLKPIAKESYVAYSFVLHIFF